jgi:hypothetical protein
MERGARVEWWRLAVRGAGAEGVGGGGTGMLYLSPGDLRFILASLASIRLCIQPPTARLRRAVISRRFVQAVERL